MIVDYSTYPWAQTVLTQNREVCGIYMIHNKINNRIYIGQSIHIFHRWREHLNEHRPSLIHQAILKYGKENFDFWIVEECNQEKLNDREKYWADIFPECYAPNGYNIVECGTNQNSFFTSKEVSCYDFNGLLINTYPSLYEAERQLGIAATNISECTKQTNGAKTCGGWYWAFGHEKQINVIKPKTGKYGGKTVYQYDLYSGQYLREFNSLADAERWLEIKGANKNISSCCNKKIKSCYNYGWSYEFIDNYTEHRNFKPKKVIVTKYSLDGHKLETFSSLSNAAKSIDTTKGNIWVCCNNIHRTCKGFRWQYGEKDYLKELQNE